MVNTIAETPLNRWQLFVKSLQLYKADFLGVFSLGLVLSLIAFIPRILSLTVGQDVFAALPMTSPHHLWLFVIEIASLIIFSAILWRLYCTLTLKHDTLMDDMRIAIIRLPSIIIAAFIQGIIFASIMLTGYIFYYFLKHQTIANYHDWAFYVVVSIYLINFFIVVFLLYLFIFYVPLIVVENQGILSSLSKSAYLVWRNWWRTFSLQVSPWLVYLMIILLIRFLFRIPIHVVFAPTPGNNTILVTGVHIILFALFIPWLAAIQLVQLNDLELRKSLE